MSVEFTLERGTDGRKVSELALATAKGLSASVRAPTTTRATVPLGSPDAQRIVDLSTPLLMAVYDVNDNMAVDGDRVLIAHTRCIGYDEVATADQQPTVAGVFSDPMWVLTRRLIGKTAAGFKAGDPLALMDRGAVVASIVAAANAEGPSGIRIGTVQTSAGTYVDQWFYKPAREAIDELCATLDGPEWFARPIEFDAATGAYCALDLAPSLATLRPAAAFEYGDGRLNVRSYHRIGTLDGSANRVHGLPPGFPDTAGGGVITVQDDASIAARGLLEATVSADLSAEALRRELVNEHVAARATQRVTISLEPVQQTYALDDRAPRVPRLGRELNVGDVVPFRVTVVPPAGPDGQPTTTAVPWINVTTRVYGYDVSVDALGNGTPALTVSPS